MAPDELEPYVTGCRDGHQVRPGDLECVEQLGKCVGLILSRAADRDWRVVVAGAGRLDDGEPMLGQSLVPEPRVARGVPALENEDGGSRPSSLILDRPGAGRSSGAA